MLLLVWLAVWIPRLTGPINLRWDASAYYILGTALAEGKGYRLLNEPGEIHAVQYPPLLPAIVAAHQRILGTNDYAKVGCALRRTYFVLSALFLLMVYSLARRVLSPWYALSVGIITALSFYSFLEISDVLYAELPFAVAAVGFLLCQHKSDRYLYAALTGILGAAAYLLRTAGIVLLLTWIAESLIRRRFGQALMRIGISAVPILLWQGYIWRVTSSDEYRHPAFSYQRADYYYPNVTYGQNSQLIDPFRPELGHMSVADLGKRLFPNVVAIPSSLAESAVIPLESASYLAAMLQRNLHVELSNNLVASGTRVLAASLLFGGLLAIVGAVLVSTGRDWFLSLYFGVNLAIIAITPWQDQFRRYLVAVAPLTLMFTLVALMAAGQWLRHRRLKWLYAVGGVATMSLVAVVLLSQLTLAIHLLRNLDPVSYWDDAGRERICKVIKYGVGWHALDFAFEWVRRNAPETAVVGTIAPQLAFLRTGHKAVLPPFELDPNRASRLLNQVPVTYLILDKFGRPGVTEQYMAPVIAYEPQDWRLVFTAPDNMAHVYERTR